MMMEKYNYFCLRDAFIIQILQSIYYQQDDYLRSSWMQMEIQMNKLVLNLGTILIHSLGASEDTRKHVQRLSLAFQN